MIIYLNSLINIGEKQKALKLVKEELSMPYIPMNFEDKFIDIQIARQISEYLYPILFTYFPQHMSIQPFLNVCKQKLQEENSSGRTQDFLPKADNALKNYPNEK